VTELSFLVELILNPKLPRPIKELVAARIKEVETSYESGAVRSSVPRPSGPQQAASTLAAMARHDVPVEQVAQSQAAVATIAHKNELIAAVKADRPMTNPDGSKRKW
jgi:hypothetical protein